MAVTVQLGIRLSGSHYQPQLSLNGQAIDLQFDGEAVWQRERVEVLTDGPLLVELRATSPPGSAWRLDLAFASGDAITFSGTTDQAYLSLRREVPVI